MLKYPGGEIAFWSILVMLAGTFVAYLTFAEGRTGLGLVFAVPVIGCVLIWFDVRPAKWLVVAYLCIATLGAVGILISTGFAWLLLLRGAMAAYGAYQFAIWDGGPNAE